MGYLYIDLSATQTLPDPVVLREQAPLLSAAGEAFHAQVSDAADKWRVLGGLYETPQSSLVLNAMAAPAWQAQALTASTAAAARTISDFAESVQNIRTTRTDLQIEINAAENDLVSLLGSEEDPTGGSFENALFNYQTDFSKRADALATTYEEARAACLAGLSGIGRVSSDTSSYYASGTLDLVSHDVERLHRRAVSAGATPEDVQHYYDALAAMDPADYADYAQDYPEAAVYPPRIGLAADQQAAFWQSLTPDQQEALAQALPSVVGNTEGVPYGLRAAANAAVLALVMKPSWRATDAQREAYKNIEASLGDRNTKDPSGRHLIAFDPADPPLAAVAIGNMDTATNVTVNVSGMDSSTQDMEGAVWAADSIHTAQGQFLSDHAVVAWIGYDSPGALPSTEVFYSDEARVGGAKLATVIDGLYYTRSSDIPSVSITAHSYGTTTAAYALSQTTHTVDSAVFYGSAGIDPEAARTAADLNAREVYATQGSADIIAPGGILGSDLGDPRISPTSESFGAKVFSSEELDVEGEHRGANGGHSMRGTNENAAAWETEPGGGYLDSKTSSIWQIAAASTGNGSSVDLIPESLTDSRVEAAKERAEDIYYGPGRVVDDIQVFGDHAADTLQEGHNRAAEIMQERLLEVSDVLQEHYLPDFGPYENPLDPLVDEKQREAVEIAEAAREQHNQIVDHGQHMVEDIVDTQQKEADEYFKRQLQVLEFRAGKLVEIFRD